MRRGATVAERFRSADMSDVVVGATFLNNVACVVVGGAEKAEVERMCHAAGGKIWQNPPKVLNNNNNNNRRCVIITSTPTVARSIGYIRSGMYDVVSTDWVHLCARRGRFVWPPPEEMVYARSERTSREIEADNVAVRQLRLSMAITTGEQLGRNEGTLNGEIFYSPQPSPVPSSPSLSNAGSYSSVSEGQAEEILLSHPGLRPVEFLFFRCVMYFDRWEDPLAKESSTTGLLRCPEVDAAMCVALRYGAQCQLSRSRPRSPRCP